jgi:hypothetical protein
VERFTRGMARVPMVYTKVADGFKNGGILKRKFGSKEDMLSKSWA